MDRKTAKMIRLVSEKTGKSYRNMKKFFYTLSKKEKYQMRNEMRRFLQDG